jgi:hypothetical protein
MPKKPSDFTGQRIGHLMVLSRAGNCKKGGTQWNCQCDCGKTAVIRGQYLAPSKRGYQARYCSNQCKLDNKIIDMMGKRYGRLVGIKCLNEFNVNGETLWQFKCDCGKVINSSGTTVRRGHTMSCGCLHRDNHFKHGKSDTAEYRTERVRKWRQRHPEKAHAMARGRQAKRFLRCPKWLTEEHKRQMAEFYRKADELTKETGTPHEVDHIYPLMGKTCSGLHVPWNMQILTKSANRKKSNRHPEEIVQSVS